MPLIKSLTRPTGVVYDAWGNVIRGDWNEVPGKTYEPGQPHLWGIGSNPGVTENYTPTEWANPGTDPGANYLSGYTGGQGLIQQALADPSFLAGTRSYAAGAPGVQSVNAYTNALLAQGIQPSELPYGQVGQIATARVQSQHGLPIASWLQPFLARALAGPAPVAGTNVGFGPPGNPLGMTDQNPPFTGAPAANIAPDVFGPLANADPQTLLSSLLQFPAGAAAGGPLGTAPKQTSLYQAMRDAILKRFAAPTTLARPV